MKRNGEIKLYIWLFCQCVTILLLFGVANLELNRSNNQWCKGYFHATSVVRFHELSVTSEAVDSLLNLARLFG